MNIQLSPGRYLTEQGSTYFPWLVDLLYDLSIILCFESLTIFVYTDEGLKHISTSRILNVIVACCPLIVARTLHEKYFVLFILMAHNTICCFHSPCGNTVLKEISMWLVTHTTTLKQTNFIITRAWCISWNRCLHSVHWPYTQRTLKMCMCQE